MISRFPAIILSSLLLVVLNSCFPGRHTANNFLKKRNTISIMVVPPGFTFLYYYPFNPHKYIIDGDTVYPVENSSFLKEANADIAQEIFYETLTNSLSGLYFNVYRPEQFDEFLNQQGKRYIFTIAQSEIIEFDDVFEDRALIDTMIYRQSFAIISFEHNNWFEFAKVDDKDENSGLQVLYSSFSISDNIDGRFRYHWLSGEVTYEYTPDLLAPDDIYRLNRTAGRENALLIMEFLMNNHVKEQEPYFFGVPPYFQYVPSRNTIRRAPDRKKFIILEP
jgi:hypothetical protein